MADILLDEQSGPTTPASGSGIIFIDNLASIEAVKDDSGRYWARSHNGAVANQTGFAADTYVTGSNVLIPSWGLQTKTSIIWRLQVSKTAAGVATPTFIIRTGTNASTADTGRHTLAATSAQTANADEGFLTIMLTVRTVGSSGQTAATAFWSHTQAATGFASDANGMISGTSTWDMTGVAGHNIGISVNGGALAAWTVTQCQVRADW
jgi:hypothetical protein